MEDYTGKICPFCKTEIKEGDDIIVCAACGIPHHKGCWEENHGCTTFGCSEQHYETQGTNPSSVCRQCGTPLGDGQAFCPNCGAPKIVEEKKSVCGNCGTELREDQSFCPQCGQRAGFAVDNSVNTAINQFNKSVEQKKKKSKAVPIVIAIVAVIAIVIGAVLFNIISEKRAEELRNEYLDNVESFVTLALTAGVNLEDIADTIQDYWYDNIWNDMWGDDINDAIFYAMLAKSDEIDQAEEYDAQLKTLYNKIKRVPDGLSDDDIDYIEEICDAAKDLYNVYTDFYELATDPSGNYNSYSSNNANTTDEFLSRYRAISNLIE